MVMPNRTTMALMAFALGGGGLPSLAVAQEIETADAAEPMSADAIQMANWVTASGDNQGLPFIVIDKIAAEVIVFDAEGQFLGATPALLGVAHGDDTAPGIGHRELSAIRHDERTTPAGRFVAVFGPASGNHRVLWVDYESSLALHPVVTANKKERRVQRLQSPSPKDNRITFGCINISASFYEKTVRTSFRNASGIVYILPETKPINAVFPTFRVQEQPGSEVTLAR